MVPDELAYDLISTGSPPGIGYAQKIKLQPGNRIRGEIDGLGALKYRVEALQMENEVAS